MTKTPSDQNTRRRLLVQDKERLADVDLKHERVRELLKTCGAHGLLLRDPANIAWFTAGADVTRLFTEQPSTSLFITPEARLFATNTVDSAQIFEREAFALGFQLKQREWFQPHNDLLEDLCRGRKVITDAAITFGGSSMVRVVPKRIQKVRQSLTELEVTRLRTLARAAAHAVEAAARNLNQGTTEAMVAGEVAHRLIKRTITPAQIRVCADERIERYRHWTYGDTPIENGATISVVARRWGLHVGVSRTVCIETVPVNLWDAHQNAALLHGTAQFFSRSGESLRDIWKKVHRIYEKFGIPNEWQKSDQGSVIGYSAAEQQIVPDSDYTLGQAVPVMWHPSVGPAMMGDTVLANEDSIEQLTHSTNWPQLTVHVKGQPLACPGILKVPSKANSSDASDSQTTSNLLDAFDDPDESMAKIESIWELDLREETAAFGQSNVQYTAKSTVE